MTSQMQTPNANLGRRSFGHSVPGNVTESNRTVKASDEGQKEKFVVRRAASLDDLQWVVKRASEEGWTPREKDAECYFAAGLTSNFFIGELNGERITSLWAVYNFRTRTDRPDHRTNTLNRGLCGRSKRCHSHVCPLY